ncbi:MAG TPA: sigma-70 family RNA polymerase sigma factor [Acidimicrobiales bacterium]|nr:sigma-70 family RNA polymerase sigma factor [Acidimicrobiales bacterium]
MDQVDELVTRAAADDEHAWSLLVDRFSGLVWSVARSVGLDDADAADVSQTTWMRLAEHLDQLNDTSRVGAWLATTARREAIRVSRLGVRHVPVDPWQWLDRPDDAVDDPELAVLATERELAVQMAVALLPDRCRRMLIALSADPPASYTDLSSNLGVPMGSIGPTRSRCLQRLERLLREGQQQDTVTERMQ